MSEHRWRLIVIFISRIEPPHPRPTAAQVSRYSVAVLLLELETNPSKDFTITRKAPNRVS